MDELVKGFLAPNEKRGTFHIVDFMFVIEVSTPPLSRPNGPPEPGVLLVAAT